MTISSYRPYFRTSLTHYKRYTWPVYRYISKISCLPPRKTATYAHVLKKGKICIPSTIWRCVHRVSYCNVYISRPTRCTNSYESLLIIKRSTCFGLLSPSPGATFCEAVYQLVYSFKKRFLKVYTNWYITSKNVAPGDGLKRPKHVERLMINKDSL